MNKLRPFRNRFPFLLEMFLGAIRRTFGEFNPSVRFFNISSSARLDLLIAAFLALIPPLPAQGKEARRIPFSVPQDQEAAVILDEVVICKQPQRYIGWPTIATAANGDLVVVFSGDRDWHVCPWGKIFLTRSKDGGKTWSEPEVIVDTPLDDRGAGLVRLADGSLLLYFTAVMSYDDPTVERYKPYQEHAASITKETRDQWAGHWTRISHDHGKTWGPYRRSPTGTPHGPTALADGGILFVRPSVYRSDDAGGTWETIAQIPRDPATWRSRYAFLSEQHALETKSGKIIALSRYASQKGDAPDNELRLIESQDGGHTWTQPRKTGMVGYPAHLLELDNGWILASYGRRIPPMGQRACLSKDEGKTWLVNEEILLSNACPQGAGDLGYPSSAQLPDGTIWTVYYQVEKTEDGEYPALMGTHWKLKTNKP